LRLSLYLAYTGVLSESFVLNPKASAETAKTCVSLLVERAIGYAHTDSVRRSLAKVRLGGCVWELGVRLLSR
jgi:hypothetical protein